MKSLVTHNRPHLDDICGIWLLKRFFPDAKDAVIEFTSSGPEGEKHADTDDRALIGVGRGKFDEHKGDVGQCATTLVYAWLKERVAFDDVTRSALDAIVAWVLLEDTGMLMTIEHRQFTLAPVMRWEYERAGQDSHASVEFGMHILDVLLLIQKNEALLKRDWESRKEFDSPYGKAVVMVTDAMDNNPFAYAKGFTIVATVNPAGTYHNIKAPATADVDLTPVYEKLQKVDPKAEWFFHHSKRMLICGGPLAPESATSALDADGLVDVIK
jgi:hypothetical protein